MMRGSSRQAQPEMLMTPANVNKASKSGKGASDHDYD